MNAKKIMGAVLVALLAAALFVGAGAAAEKDLGTVFVFQNTTLEGTWTGDNGSVTFVDGVIGDKTVKEGKYTKGNESIYVEFPTVTISAIANATGKLYPFMGGTLYNSSSLSEIDLTVVSPAGASVVNLLVTYPNGVVVPAWKNNAGQGIFNISATTIQNNDPTGYYNGTVPLTIDVASISKLLDGQTGVFKIQAVFAPEGATPDIATWSGAIAAGDKQLVSWTPEEFLVSKDIFSFTVVNSGEVTATADVDTVIEQNLVTLTITGVPGETYTIVADEFAIVSSGITAITAGTFTMPNDGKIVVQLKALDVGEQTIKVQWGTAPDIETVEVSIEVVEGAITAQTDAESYYIGNKVEISGTNTAGGDLKFYIEGTNKNFAPIQVSDFKKDGTSWSAVIKGSEFDNYDAGTYTLYVTNVQKPGKDNVTSGAYTTAAVVLKQPFISVTEAPSVAVQGNEYVVKGTAEAANDVYAYVFGTNFFTAANSSDNEKMSVDINKGVFTVKILKNVTKEISAGQYFMVVQHPMYDGNFNIWANGTAIMTAPTNKSGALELPGKELFNVKERQKANAAEALCQALDTENIDDMYVKLSFVVAAPQSTINPIPETITQGEKLTVSGSTNMGKGELVTVEILSTAFAAVPKATVGSASFISLITKTDENGNWEVTFDTSGLNVDEYTVSAAVSTLDATTAKINVVEAAPEQPDQPDVPGDEPEQPGDEPVAPETPGFGALAALAGLGAVAVLLLRRE